MPSDPVRRARGAQKYTEMMGGQAEALERNFADAPELGEFILENVFGGIYQNPVLDNRTRMIINVAALAALGTATPQLKNYLNGALRNGVTREQLIAIMVQIAAFAGVPAGINGVTACREVFAAQDAKK